MLTIKCGRMPGSINEYALNDGAKVSDVLALAGITLGASDEIRVGGNVVTESAELTNNTIVLITARIKGNADTILVKVGKMPGSINEFAVASGTKVAELLTLAGITLQATDEVRMSGMTVSQDSIVTTDGAIVLITAKIKGN